jgi:valyl-tRNA synthetase
VGSPASSWLPLIVEPADASAASAIEAGRAYIETLAHVRPIEMGTDGERPALVATTPLGAAWLGGGSDEDAAERRAAKQSELEASIERLRALLANDSFVSRAPVDVVERERERLRDFEDQLRQLG